ncbi:uncharacterized protein LOC133737214 [Rosa rugosa]|uniref:uncharacterized protein LOC133737214 n=1 Tax=Rosa rugosa TaxID=74645 RepID=UPI002B405DA0|nr:uncharacterized protein LOC133737214 [Rosa rugosa]
MEEILRNMGLIARTRLAKVCMSWSSLVMRAEIRSAPQLPWLVHPQTPNTNYLTFSSLSEGEVVNMELPKRFRGQGKFKFRASSKGWLIILQEKGFGFDMFLYNPISRARHQLPSLNTIPSFLSFQLARMLGKVINNHADKHAENFVSKVVLSSPNISECIVAAVFEPQKELGLCRPGDKSWTVFEILNHEDDFLMDLLFSQGMLYGLVDNVDNSKSTKNGIGAARILNFGDDQAMTVELKLVYGHKEVGNTTEYHDDYLIFLNRDYNSYLLESTTNSDKEILLIHQMLDCLMPNCAAAADDDDDDDESEIEYQRTSGFVVYKIDLECGNFHEVQNLGDQIIFLAEHSSSLSFPASDFKLQGNCIYFATSGYATINLPLKTLLGSNISREIGIFSLDDRKIKRPFPSLDVAGISSPSQLSWFSPSL